MKLSIFAEDVSFSIKNLRKGNEITGAKQSGEIVINGTSVPFILQNKVSGFFREMIEGFRSKVVLAVFDQPKTKYTKNGYVVLRLTFSTAQFWIYIKREHLAGLFRAILSESI